VQFELESLFTAICDELGILSQSVSPGKKLPSSQINVAFAAFEAKVNQIRPQGILLKAPLQTAMDFASGIAVLRRLRDELNNIRGAIEGLPRFGQAVPEEKAQWKLVPTIDWFWVRIGIKGGLAAVAAILCLKWIHPPGPANVPTWAWLFVVLRRTFFRLGGSSDLRSFQTAIYGSLILAGSAALLVFFTPLLASYAVMNVALFVVLFATGFFTATTRGITFWSEFTFLTTSAFVALNPQVPVSSQTIIDSFVGIIFGLWIATVVSRLIWPILPQRILRYTLIALFARMKALLAGPQRENIMTQLTDLPVEALRTLRQIQLAGCSREEKTKFAAVVNSLQRLVSRLGQLVSRRNLMPEIAQEILKPHFDRIEVEFKQVLDAFAEHFHEGHWPCEFPTVQGALIKLDDTVEQIRHRDLLGHLPSETTLRFLDIIDCYHATAEALQECGRLIGALQIDRYWVDFGL
jgi:Fusaric acid resistance protein family